MIANSRLDTRLRATKLPSMTQTYPLTITRKRRLYGAFRPLRIYVKTPQQRQAFRLGQVKQGQSLTIDVPNRHPRACP